MSDAQGQRGPGTKGAQVPVTGRAARIAQEIRDRRQGLVAWDEVGAIDVAALVLAALADSFASRIPSISADQQPRYRRKQLDGERGIDLCEFVWICRSEPELAAPAFAELVSSMREALPPKGVAEEIAETCDAFGRAMSKWSSAMADGRLDLNEALELRPLVSQVQEQAGDILAALAGAIRKELNG